MFLFLILSWVTEVQFCIQFYHVYMFCYFQGVSIGFQPANHFLFVRRVNPSAECLERSGINISQGKAEVVGNHEKPNRAFSWLIN